MYIYTYIYLHTHTYTHTHTYMYIFIFMSKYLSENMYISTKFYYLILLDLF